MGKTMLETKNYTEKAKSTCTFLLFLCKKSDLNHLVNFVCSSKCSDLIIFKAVG